MIDRFDAEFFDVGSYAYLSEARSHKATQYWATTYGLDETVASIENAIRVAEKLDYRSSAHLVMAWKINGKTPLHVGMQDTVTLARAKDFVESAYFSYLKSKNRLPKNLR